MLHRHRHLTAWLGVLAIWFAIAAPLVSQWRVAQAATPDAIVCSTEHGAHPSPDAGRMHDHALHLDACGYCGFSRTARDRRASRRGTRFHSVVSVSAVASPAVAARADAIRAHTARAERA